MKREHKAGLAVSVAFLALLAVVVVVKLREPAASPSARPSPTLAMGGVKEDLVGSDPAPGDDPDKDKSGGKLPGNDPPPVTDPSPSKASPGPGLGEPGNFSNPGPVVQVKAGDPRHLPIDPPPPPMNDDPPPPPPVNDDPPPHPAKPVDGGFTPLPPPLAPGGDAGDPPPPADGKAGKLPPIGPPDPADDPDGDGKPRPDHGKPAPVNDKHDGDPPPIKAVNPGAFDPPPPPVNDPPPPARNDREPHAIKIEPPPPSPGDRVDPPAPARIDPPPPAVVPAPDPQGRPVIVIPPTGNSSNPPPLAGVGAPVIAATAGSSGATVDSWDELTHVCQSGDSFSAVARRYYNADEYAEALQLYNRNHPRASDAMRRDGVLQPGDRLYVPPAAVLEKRHGSAITKPKAPGTAYAPPPGDGVQTAAFTGAPQPLTMSPPAPPSAPTYTVPQPGEPLASIARRTLQNSSRWQEIARLNPNLQPEAPVPPGTVVRLPADALVPAAGKP